MDNGSTLDTALQLAEAGISVIPVRDDGTKAPAVDWTAHMTTAPTTDKLHTWFGNGKNTGRYTGLGIVCGTVSGNLEMLELEGRAIGRLTDLATIADASGLGPLWKALTGSWVEQSPSGGLHIHYRVDGPAARNTKLAWRPATPDELAVKPLEKRKVLVETRGEGGFVVTSPTPGSHHETGRPWIRLIGGPDTIATLTVEERDAIYDLARTIDETPAPDPQPQGLIGGLLAADTPHRADGGISPGDDYETRTDWTEILIPAGWTLVHSGAGRTRYWRRPGKTIGISATTGHADDRDRLFVFTTSTEFESEHPYTKFAAYAALHHSGDYRAAATQLRRDGYGKEPTRATATPPPAATTPAPAGDVDGNLATVHDINQHAKPDLQMVTRTLERSDDGNALHLIDEYGDTIRFCHDRGRWYAWDNTRWHEQPADGGIVREYAKTLARIYSDSDTGALAHKRKSLSAVGITNTLIQARTDERIAVTYQQFDSHPYELNTPAGIVNLTTGECTRPDPSRLHTRVTACAPDPTLDATQWTEFLTDTFGDDNELVSYLRRLVGYSAIGHVGPHVLPFCYGSGGNGKGVFLEAIAKTLGDYATSAPSGFLMTKNYSGHETEKARLSGARMVICSEVNEHDRFDEARVKELTGGDSITARFMRQDYFTFTPTHQLWLMGNYQPAVDSGGPSFWRRLRLIPFTKTVPENKRVDDLQGILARDLGPAILTWIIAGAAGYAAGGLNEPESVRAATEAYQRDQDTVRRFLDDQCRIGGGDQVEVRRKTVITAYEKWCSGNGDTPVTTRKLGSELRRHGVGVSREGAGDRSPTYTNLSLIGDADEESVTRYGD